MPLPVDTLTIDCHDPKVLADFWCAALGYRLDHDDEEDAVVKPAVRAEGDMLFQIVPEAKTVKNRLHLDVRPSGVDGRRGRARWSSSAPPRSPGWTTAGSFWTVMGDPEGNEFCVLRGPEDGWSA